VKIATTAALTVTNLVAFLNAPNTTVADAANAGYNSLAAATISENGFTDQQGDALHGLVATDVRPRSASAVKGAGKVSVSNVFTSRLEPLHRCQAAVQSLIVVGKNVFLAIRNEPDIYRTSSATAWPRTTLMWTVYDNKVSAPSSRDHQPAGALRCHELRDVQQRPGVILSYQCSDGAEPCLTGSRTDSAKHHHEQGLKQALGLLLFVASAGIVGIVAFFQVSFGAGSYDSISNGS